MSSSPPRTAQNTPTRTPLQERTPSQTNEQLSRIPRNGKADAAYGASPFPTKPQHVLLPSTIRKQKSQRNLGIEIFRNDYGFGSSSEVQSAPPVPRQPAVRLRKSVKTLRDMYEAQSDDSRPSTALSASRSRPGSSSSKLRSFSSSDGLSGRYAWEQFKNAASDDMALLPSLPEDDLTLRQVNPKSSFATRSAALAATSSPNFRVIGGISSPRAPALNEIPSDGLSGSDRVEQSSSSSPNVMRFGRSDSLDELPAVDEASSPNFVRLGTSSPGREAFKQSFVPSSNESPLNGPSSSPNFIKLGTSSPARTVRGYEPTASLRRVPSSSSDMSRKRKRSCSTVDRALADSAGDDFPSSSPPDAFDPAQSLESLRSSPPLPPVARTKSVLMQSPDATSVLERSFSREYDQSSVSGTHNDLQIALSSSPAPPIQYPVIRAPSVMQAVGLSVHKRQNRSSVTTDSIAPRWPSRRSGGPSIDNSKRSSMWEDTDEAMSADEDEPEHYVLEEESNVSQIRITPIVERHDEADDEVMGLPGDGWRYRMHALTRSASFGNASSSSQSRLNSMQSSVENHLNSLTSMRPTLRRPSSTSSLTSAVVPTWARRYYSGLYQDSFKYLIASSSMVNVAQVQAPLQTQPTPRRPDSILTTTTAETPRAGRTSLTSLRESLTEKLPKLLRPKDRPRLEARKSHLLPGVGPLVSNPVREPATAARLAMRPSHPNMRGAIRPVSLPLHPSDPRAHWAGFDEKHGMDANSGGPSGGIPYMVPPRRMSRLPSISPHLHHDHRLNTGSTASRGYGHPFNRHSRYSNPSDMLFDDSSPSSDKPLRNWHVICLMLGFICPLAWFVGSFLPLPARPDSFTEIEKGHWRRASMYGNPTEREAMHVLRQLRQEKRLRGGEELHWQNVRWWRNLNRWMSVVGGIVLILVIVLAVIGTTRGL